VTARSEPLLWLQLIGLGAIPLELLLVLLLLAGSDPGPLPGLERVLTWSLGAVAPSVLLWRMPPDPLSLLLVCTPVRLRTPGQLGFSQQPMGLPLKLLLASGTALLLPLLWWLDTTSVLATSYALLPTPNRVAALVAVAPLLTLLVWQWQQMAQASVLLGSNHQPPPSPPGDADPSAATRQTLCLGLPWLRLPALTEAKPPELPKEHEGPSEAQGEETTQPAPVPGDQSEGASDDQIALPQGIGIEARESGITDVEFTPLESAELDPAQLESAAVAVEPEEAAKEAEGSDLDPQIG